MPKINCSHCQKKITYNVIKDVPTFPFCSKKCKMIDLGVWFNEGHKIESELKPDMEVYDDYSGIGEN